MPEKKRKHFLVTELILDEESEDIIGCVLEAIIDKHTTEIDWKALTDSQIWLQGWK